jgi:hypothetical protein
MPASLWCYLHRDDAVVSGFDALEHGVDPAV